MYGGAWGGGHVLPSLRCGALGGAAIGDQLKILRGLRRIELISNINTVHELK